MVPRFLPTVDQFRPFRHHQPVEHRPERRPIRRAAASVAAVIVSGLRDRSPAFGRLRPAAEFRSSSSNLTLR